MIIHILKNGKRVKSIDGYIVKYDEFKRLYNVLGIRRVDAREYTSSSKAVRKK